MEDIYAATDERRQSRSPLPQLRALWKDRNGYLRLYKYDES